jgi:hypothetical protein
VWTGSAVGLNYRFVTHLLSLFANFDAVMVGATPTRSSFSCHHYFATDKHAT